MKIPRVPLAVEDHHAGPLRRGEPTVQESPVTRAEPRDLDRGVTLIPVALGIAHRVEEEGVDQRGLGRTWSGGRRRLRRRVESGGIGGQGGWSSCDAIVVQGRQAASWASRWRSACHAIAMRCLSESKSATACDRGVHLSLSRACFHRRREPQSSEGMVCSPLSAEFGVTSKGFGTDDEQGDYQPDQDPPERQPQPQLPHAWGLEGGASSRRL